MSIKWEAPNSPETVLSTELNSLADGANKITTTPISNDGSTELYLYADFQLYLAAQASARDNGARVELYILPEISGNYCYGGDSLDPPRAMLVGSFEFDAATNARYSHIRGVMLPPTDFHVLVINETGQAFASSGNVLVTKRYNMQSS